MVALPIDRRLPRSIFVLQAGVAFNAFGNGAVAPFLLVYLHEARRIPLSVGGLVVAWGAICALVTSLGAGALADRFGPRATLLGGLTLSATAFTLYPLVSVPWQAFAVATLSGAGGGAWLTSQASLLAVLAPPELRTAAFAQQRVAANLGLGLGGLVGGLLAAWSFTALFLVDATTFAVFGLFLLHVPAVQPPARAAAGSYREVLRSGVLVRVVALNLVFVAAAIALLNSVVPVFAHEHGLGTPAIGVLFAFNTAFIVVAQMPIARRQEGRRRTLGLAAIGASFAASWLLVLAGAWVGLIGFVAAFIVFGVGECLYDSVVGPLVAGLAPPGLTGRTMAVSGFSWQLGFILGPAAGSALLGVGALAFWPLAAAACAPASLYALTLERRLPEALRVTPEAG